MQTYMHTHAPFLEFPGLSLRGQFKFSSYLKIRSIFATQNVFSVSNLLILEEMFNLASCVDIYHIVFLSVMSLLHIVQTTKNPTLIMKDIS